MPSLRADGQRLVSGDSGAPLPMQLDGEKIVAGVLRARDIPDLAACGGITPRPTLLHGSYIPTWRESAEGLAATDIGAWLRLTAPEADRR